MSISRRREPQDLVHIEQRFAHIDRRFDDLNQQMLDFRAERRQVRNRLGRLYGLAVLGFIDDIVLTLFGDWVFKRVLGNGPDAGV